MRELVPAVDMAQIANVSQNGLSLFGIDKSEINNEVQ